MRIRTVLLIAAGLSACSKPPAEYTELRSSFQLMAEQIGQNEPCSREIPGEWSPSYPIPVLVGGVLHYRVFFRGWEGRPDTGIKLRDAEGDALFNAAGKVLECAQRAQRGRLFVDQEFAGTREAYDARVRALYASLEEFSRLYAKGVPVLDADRARVRTFASEFASLSSPGHAAAYRALSPDFWAWVEKNGGAAPSAAK